MALSKIQGAQIETPVDISTVNITGVGTITNGTITNLTGTAGTVTTLRSTTGNFTTGNIVTGVTTNFTSTNGSITNLTGTSSTITTLRSTTLNADTGNIVTGVTTNFTSTNVIISGVTTVSAGTALLPSITPSGDPNTGIFFPSADHLNFSTGGTSRVQIESDGDINIDDSGVFYDATNNRVGIGTSTPEAPLHINRIGDGTYAQSLSESRTKAGFIVNPESNNSSARLNISKGGIGDLIILQVTNAAGTGAFKILLNPYGGNVGVGHTNPGATLDIKAAAATAPLIIQGTSSEFARFDSSGRLIIGATSASYSTTVKLQGNSGSSTGESRIRFCRGQATPADAVDLGIIGFSDSTETPSAEIKAQRDGGTWSASSVPGRLTFSTTGDAESSPTERLRIDSAGLITIQADAALGRQRAYFANGHDTNFKLGFRNGSGTAVNSEHARLDFSYTTTSLGHIGFLRGSSADLYRITVVPTTLGVYIGNNETSWSSLSDERKKTNLIPIENALVKLKNVRSVTGRYLADKPETSRAFLIAQDFLTTLPEAVDATDDSEYGLRYTEVIPLLVAAIKESKDLIDQLETSNTDLLARVIALESN